MKKYKTEKILTFTGGLVGLTSKQARVRSNLLEEVDEGVYRILGKVFFKAGEIIGLDTPIKSVACFLQDVETGENVADQYREEKLKLMIAKAAETEVDMEVVVMAMYDLEKGNEDHFTKRGKPRVGAVEAIVGHEVTAEQCNDAYKEFLES